MEITCLDIESSTPLYEQLYLAIKGKIQLGELRGGQRIPSESQLSEQYNISRVTVRGALQRLADENLIVKKHGKGTFVSAREYVETFEADGSFTESCLKTNAVPGTRVLARRMVTAPEWVAEDLGLEAEARVIYLIRVRTVNSMDAIFEEDYFSAQNQFLLDIPLDDRSIIEVMREQAGLFARRFNDIFDIRAATREQANALGCAASTPLLRVRQSAYTTDDRPVFCNVQHIRSGVYKYAIQYSRHQ